ncbi:olfactory receptor 2T3-like [Amphiura filiformis]|uniref:olfactory receptor 2T3-like n=1 Tax=Amphiura filiformis TaxID=82378 RepID=UPI003B221A32
MDMMDDTSTNSSLLDPENRCEEAKISSLLYSSTERRIILTLYPISLMIGLTGNIAFLIVLACLPHMRTITNFYLGNLAVADIIFLCSLSYEVLVAYILSPVVKTVPYTSSLGCGLNTAVKYTSHIASVGLIFLVTLERYYGICKPLQHRMVVAKGRTCKLVSIAWLVGLFFAALVVPKYASFHSKCITWPNKDKYDDMPSMIKSCNTVHPFFNIFQAIVLAFPLALVLSINSVLYILIVQKLGRRVISKSKDDNETQQTASNVQSRRVRNQVARLLIITGTFFFFCCVPEFILRLNGVALTLSEAAVGFKMTARQRHVVVWLARGLTTINAVVNPIIYSVTNQQYRRAFTQVFMCRSMREKPVLKSGSNAAQLQSLDTTNTVVSSTKD